MQGWSKGFKAFGWFVVVLMVAAIGYAGITAVRYWPSIGV